MRLSTLLSDSRRLLAAAAIRAVATAMAAVLLGIYLAQRGLSLPEVGGVLSAGLGGAFAAMALVSAYADRWGRKRVQNRTREHDGVHPHSVERHSDRGRPGAALPAAAVLFLLREALVEMDVPTRQSYVMAVVQPAERTLASGVTSLVRLGGWAVSPSIAGVRRGARWRRRSSPGRQ